MPADEATHIDSTLSETRKFPPPAEFSARAWVKSREEYEALYKRADADPETFWAECARNLHWFKPFGKTLEWNFPFAKWFIGGTINASYNCLDRHLEGPRRNKAALIWEGEPGDSRVLTYQMLADEVAKCANALKSLGVKDGDRVRRGQVIARIGDTGSSFEPHLHFEVTTSPTPLAGEGLPYLINRFRCRNRTDGTNELRISELPLDKNIVLFGTNDGGAE